MTERQDDLSKRLEWRPWQPLRESWLDDHLPSMPGLSRIRRVGRTDIDYIGETGSGDTPLKTRISMLRGVYREQMPDRYPHTAGPALWALRDATGCDFEVSVAPVLGPTSWRKGLKCVAIGLYRQEHGASPTVNFGRMPIGYRMPTMSKGNNPKLTASGKRFRGGPTAVTDDSHVASIAPFGPLSGDPQSPSWCGHVWSSWHSLSGLSKHLSVYVTGLYRIRRPGMESLLYIGRGRIRMGVDTHKHKVIKPDEQQAEVISGALECSWTLNDSWYFHQRLELVNDLIAAYVLTTGAVPDTQFNG